MERHQKVFLLREFEEMVASAGVDFDRRDRLGPESLEWVVKGTRIVEWLKGGKTPGREIRHFLEERLAAFEDEHDYDEMLYEHDAYAAAIEALR